MVLAAFFAATLVVIALSVALWREGRLASAAVRDIGHIHELLHHLARTRALTLQIELTTQNFRLTGNEKQIVERDAAITGRETSLLVIRELAGLEPTQMARWQELRHLIDERLTISRKVEALRRTAGASAATAFVSTQALQATRIRTYELLDQMDQAARTGLDARVAALGTSDDALLATGASVSGLLAMLLIATYALFRRHQRHGRAALVALAEGEESLAITLRSIGEAVLVTDLQRRIVRLNPIAEQLTGWRALEAVGRSLDDVLQLRDEDSPTSDATSGAGTPDTSQTRPLADGTMLVSRDGREIPITGSISPLCDLEGKRRGGVLVFRDVTIEREAQRLVRQQNARLALEVHERTEALQESEDHLRSVLGTVPALVAFVDTARRYVYVNEQYRAWFAPDRPDITGCTVEEILGPERYAIAGPLITRVLSGQHQSYDWVPSPGIWQNISYIPRFDSADRLVGYYVLGTDITQRKQAEEEIQSLNAELALRVRDLEHVTRALRTLSAGNRTMLRATQQEALLQGMCDAAVGAGGYGVATVWFCEPGSTLLSPMAQAGFPGGDTELRKIQLAWTDDALGQGAIATAVRSGQVRWVPDIQSDPGHAPWAARHSSMRSALAFPLRVDDRIIGAFAIHDPASNLFDSDEIELLTEFSEDLAFGIAMLRSRSEQSRVQAEMAYMACHDPLTGLPNAVQFEADLVHALSDAAPAAAPSFTVLQLDIERLGEINEALGFARGDQILHDFADRLQRAAPADARVARLRGDEFALLLPGKDVAAALPVVRTLEEQLGQPFAIADLQIDLAARTGIVAYPDHGATVHDLLRHADKAVNIARKQGLAHFVFDRGQVPEPTERFHLARELRQAIEQGQLRLYLQPKVAFASGALCGAEALVRWQHPTRGLVPPALFIDLAEQTGLIRPLTQWVIEQVLDVLDTRRQAGPNVPIAVNLSARNLREEQFLHGVGDGYRRRGLPPGLLEFEITESTLMEDPDFALALLHGLRDEGFPLYIDDFGTGYSSLSYLQKLPVDSIKIDRSFVAGLPHDRDSTVIVESTIDLAHDLGRRTVAEGIETAEQWERLAAFGCDVAQGYLLSPPLPVEDFVAWARRFAQEPMRVA